ncbi:MAG: NADH-quinone oxidoreductase subunit I [Ignavibacteriae bacterium]|nr:NADH-quinone oxidoreductase subunit I [Ignavibacteriota bacterium]
MGTYFRNIWEGVWTVLVGMKITFMHMFTPAVTIQYPDVRLKLPERARNRLYVNMDDCIGCDQCSMACPVDCITIETLKSTPDVDLGLTSVGTKKRLYVTRFDIDIAKCCYCGLCVPPCPTECIKMTDVYEFSEFERTNLIYKFSTMASADIDGAKTKLAAYEKEQAEKKAAAPKPVAPAATPAARVPAGAKPVGVPAGAKPVGVPAAKPATQPEPSPNDPPTNSDNKA